MGKNRGTLVDWWNPMAAPLTVDDEQLHLARAISLSELEASVADGMASTSSVAADDDAAAELDFDLYEDGSIDCSSGDRASRALSAPRFKIHRTAAAAAVASLDAHAPHKRATAFRANCLAMDAAAGDDEAAVLMGLDACADERTQVTPCRGKMPTRRQAARLAAAGKLSCTSSRRALKSARPLAQLRKRVIEARHTTCARASIKLLNVQLKALADLYGNDRGLLLAADFESAAMLSLERKPVDRFQASGRFELFFHGTRSKNIDSIAQLGLVPGGTHGLPISHGAVYGKGVYVTPSVRAASSYGDTVLVVAVARGAATPKTTDICVVSNCRNVLPVFSLSCSKPAPHVAVPAGLIPVRMVSRGEMPRDAHYVLAQRVIACARRWAARRSAARCAVDS